MEKTIVSRTLREITLVDESGYDVCGFKITEVHEVNFDGMLIAPLTYKLSCGPKILVGIADVKLQPN